MKKKTLLLNPGPVTLTESVRLALQKEDLCHREVEFADLQKSIIQKLKNVYPESSKTHTPILLTGSGTSAVESMLQSLCPKEKPVLILANGVYGERMASMLSMQQKPFDVISFDWKESIDLNKLENALKEKSYAYIITVHHETTTGRLNDIASIAEIAKKYSVPILLDSVSSFGGEWIDLSKWNIACLAATANKCLHSVPGISFVIPRNDLLEKEKTHSTSLYLDFFKYYENQKTGFSPFTQSVHALYALDQALEEFHDAGGWQERNTFYYKKTHFLMKAFSEMGIKLFLENEEIYSGVLVSFFLPKEIRYEPLHDHLKENGFIIYAGQGNFQGHIFRIAVMGDVSMLDLERLISVMKNFLSMPHHS